MKKLMMAMVGLAALGLAGCTGDSHSLTMAVGTYTDNGSEGIYTFSFDTVTGQVQGLDTLQIANPSYVNFNERGTRLYAVSENNEASDSVSAIEIDAKSGKMKWLGALPTRGAASCYVEACGQVLLTANYNGGTMSVFQLSPEGNLERMVGQMKGTTGGPDTARQKIPHVHTARVTPDRRYVLATDFAADRLLRMAFDGMSVNLNSMAVFHLSRDYGPRHIEFSPDGQAVYVIGELSGTVTVFNYNGGALQRVQEVKSDTVGARGSADIHITPDGRFLYTSNRLKADGLRIFKVDQKSHQLTSVGYQPTGLHPRNFAITPDGKWLLCACRDSNEIQIFKIDPATGALKQVGKPIALPHPVCIKFAPK